MKIVDLNGKKHEWSLTPLKWRHNIQSHLQQHATKIIREIFPTTKILAEVPIPITEKKQLIIDLFLPSLKIAFEIQGRQHLEYVPYFQKFKYNFYRQLKRDRDKKEWCDINNISLIFLACNEIKEWKQQIIQCIQ